MPFMEAGNMMATRMAKMAMTTSISMRVKADFLRMGGLLNGLWGIVIRCHEGVPVKVTVPNPVI